MPSEGRETERLLRGAVQALERNAQATEKMLAIAEREQIQMEYAPPLCPGCGKIDPVVTQLEGDGSGKLSEFVMKGETHCCNRTVYAIPTGFNTTDNMNMVDEIFNHMKGGN